MSKKTQVEDDYQLESHVNVKGEWIPVREVDFIDISEDFQGYDLMTFRYDGEVHQSRITTRPC